MSKTERLKADTYSKIDSKKSLELRKSDMIKGNYPASMTDCETIGINGDCNKQCFLYNKIKECNYDENAE